MESGEGQRHKIPTRSNTKVQLAGSANLNTNSTVGTGTENLSLFSSSRSKARFATNCTSTTDRDLNLGSIPLPSTVSGVTTMKCIASNPQLTQVLGKKQLQKSLIPNEFFENRMEQTNKPADEPNTDMDRNNGTKITETNNNMAFIPPIRPPRKLDKTPSQAHVVNQPEKFVFNVSPAELSNSQTQSIRGILKPTEREPVLHKRVENGVLYSCTPSTGSLPNRNQMPRLRLFHFSQAQTCSIPAEDDYSDTRQKDLETNKLVKFGNSSKPITDTQTQPKKCTETLVNFTPYLQYLNKVRDQGGAASVTNESSSLTGMTMRNLTSNFEFNNKLPAEKDVDTPRFLVTSNQNQVGQKTLNRKTFKLFKPEFDELLLVQQTVQQQLQHKGAGVNANGDTFKNSATGIFKRPGMSKVRAPVPKKTKLQIPDPIYSVPIFSFSQGNKVNLGPGTPRPQTKIGGLNEFTDMQIPNTKLLPFDVFKKMKETHQLSGTQNVPFSPASVIASPMGKTMKLVGHRVDVSKGKNKSKDEGHCPFCICEGCQNYFQSTDSSNAFTTETLKDNHHNDQSVRTPQAVISVNSVGVWNDPEMNSPNYNIPTKSILATGSLLGLGLEPDKMYIITKATAAQIGEFTNTATRHQ